MRDIEGVEDVVRSLAPHWKEIEAHFHQENAQLIELLRHDHDSLGRVLKCHLIVEHYLDRFLAEFLNLQDIVDAKLSFFQKAKLLPNQGSATAFVKPGILKLNSIRNRFGHTLRPDLNMEELGPINEVLALARPNNQGDHLSRIEAFTTVAVAFLVVPPPNLQAAFLEAFRAVRVNAAQPDP
ncbi:MAG: hypothetical protein Q7V56_15320 [Gammaproteobacteria bacterium]|nr:hypothetical protein [Gammaproteobacteria bacterium]